MEKGDKLDFYTKLKKEYEKGAKPFTYQFSFGQQPKHKKFRILLGKFVQILKEGMKDEYRFEQGNAYSYWSQLQKHFKNLDEMSYIIHKVYEVAQKKTRIFFALLIHTHKIFEVFQNIISELGFLYLDIEKKRKNIENDISPILFLKDGHLEVDSSYVRQFQAYLIPLREEKIQNRKAITELLEEMAESVDEAIKEEKRKEEVKVREEKKALSPPSIPKTNEPQNVQTKPQVTVPSEAPVIVPRQVTMPNKPSNFRKPKVSIMLQQPVTEEPDLLDLKKKPKHLKNSEHLFNQKYKDELQVFFYAQRPIPSEEKKECFECKQPLSQGLIIFGSNINYCNYIGEWFCNDHTAEERVQIPYKAREDFDLKGYSVSKSGFERIKQYYQKPIIEIGYNDPCVKRNKRLYDFLILRRQIHLMYDTICNSELMDKMLRGRLNYCLQKNLFSLKNLYDIYNGHEGPHLEGQFSILSKHFYRCEQCQQRKGRLCSVCNHPPKVFAFQLRQTYCCERCQKISHRRCLLSNKCVCE